MLLDLSQRSELVPLVSTLRAIQTVGVAHAVQWFLVGAVARDLLLTYRYSMAPIQATLDIDLAASCDSWMAFEHVMNALVTEHGFERVEEMAHRLKRGSETIDIIPFGACAENGRLARPPDGSIEMSVLGFDEAFRSTVEVKLPGDLLIRIVSLPALLLLKLLAWEDRHLHRPRHDAIDIRQILIAYSQGDLPYIYEHPGFLEIYQFDPVLAGAALIGADAFGVAGDVLRIRITKLLATEADEDGRLALASEMSRDVSGNLSLLQALSRGFAGRTGSRWNIGP